jgi:hypothetical protein
LRDVRVVHVQQLQHFAFGNHVGGVRQICITRILFRLTIIWNAREYRKSPTSTEAALPNRALAGGAAAAQRRFVDHVVVQQGGGVDEFTTAASSWWALPW